MGPGTEFDAFFTATWPRLFRTAYAVAGSRSDAEDALQNAYAKAYSHWRRIQATEHPEAYVRRIVVNEVLGARRRPWSRREVPTETIGESTSTAASHEDPMTDRDAVWNAVQCLAPRQRAVIVLRYYEDLSEESIARVLGCSRGTVKSTAARALDNLRRSPAAADLVRGELA